MKLPLLTGYVFTPGTRKIDFSGVPGFDLRRLFMISSLTVGDLYVVGDPELGYTDFANGVLTLAYDTRALNAADPLLVIYEDLDTASNTKLEQLRTYLATAGKQDEAKAVLQAILAAVQAQRSETIWTDDTGARFIRIDSGGTISWTDVAGNASSPPGAGARPDYDSGLVISRSTWRATAAGTGFSSGDYLDHFVVTDGDAGDPISNYWFNITTGAKLTAAPSAASISPYSPLPDGAATAAKQDTGNTSLASILTVLGTLATDADLNAGFAAVVAKNEAIRALLAGTLAVSAASLPLPTGAATAARQDTGNASLSSLDGKTPALVNGGSPVAQVDAIPSGSPFTLASGAAAGAVIGTFDTTGMATVDLFVEAFGGGPIQAYAQASDGSANWAVVPMLFVPNASNGQGRIFNNAFTTGLWRINVVGKTMQLRVAGATTGATTVAVLAKSAPSSVPSTYVEGGTVGLPTVAGSPVTNQVAVATGTSPTPILPAGRSDQQVTIKNTGTVKAYIGGAGVTAATGFPLAAGEQITMDTKVAQGAISAILDSAQATAGQISVFRF